MVSVYVHPLIDQAKARTLIGAESVSLKITTGSGEITICGNKENIEAFGMIADIFNDAFAKKENQPT